MLAELKECFMEAYDDNKDGKIEIRELAQLLPLEESFLLLFRFDNPLESSVEFMKIWREYDSDNSGYIEADELKNFLRDLLKEAKKECLDEDKLVEYTDTLLQIFDSNKDGKLQLSEMAKLLPVKENFLNRSTFKGASKITKDDIERVFSLYDRVRDSFSFSLPFSPFVQNAACLCSLLHLQSYYDFCLSCSACGCLFSIDSQSRTTSSFHPEQHRASLFMMDTF